MTPVWDDAEQLAAVIREARGGVSQKEVGRPIGVNYKKWQRWEKPELATIGKTPEERYATALLAAEATGKPELFGLSGPATEEVDLLRDLVGAQARSVKTLAEELSEVRTAQAETLSRLERLERGAGGGAR